MSLTIEKIVEMVSGELIGDGTIEIYRVSSLETAQAGEISFIEKADLSKRAVETNASCLFVTENFQGQLPCTYIKVKNPKIAFAKIARNLHPQR